MADIYVSPSQIAVFRECRRKWAFRYIDRIKLPQKPTQAFGTEGHERNERYLKTGEHVGDDDVGLVCQQGIKPGCMPLPAPDLLIESKLTIPILDGAAVMIGYMDCVQPPREATPIPVTYDWKFTKDLRWAMKVAELQQDPQGGIYTFAVMKKYGVEEVLARWVYFCGRVNAKSEDGRPRTPRGVRPVELLFDKRMILDNWKSCLNTAKEIVLVKRGFDKAIDVEPDESHCDAYGGCDYRDKYCPVSNEINFEAMFAQHDKLNKTLTQSINTDTPPDPTPTEKKMGSPLLDMLKKGPAGDAEAKTEAPAETKADEKTETKATNSPIDALLAAKQEADGLKGVNPPAEHNKDEPKAETKAEETTPTAEPESPEEAEAAAAEAEAAKAVAKAAAAKAKAAKAKAEAAAAKKAEAKPMAKTKTSGAGGFVLAIDAVPAKVADGGNVLQFADFIAPIAEAVAKKHRCDDHPKGVEHWGLIEFGNGKGLLATAVARALDAEPFDGIMILDSGTPEAAAVKEVLIRRADVIFRGVR